MGVRMIKKNLVVAFFLLIVVSVLQAKVPPVINYQGRLLEKSIPVNGNRLVLFRMYDSLTAGTLVWSGDAQIVHLTNGLFQAYIGEITSISSPSPFSNINWGNGDRYLEIQVGADVLQPRERLTSVCYSFLSRVAERVDWANIANKPDSFIPSGAILMWSGTTSTIPSGWALCDGTHGTPDLRGRFIVCYDPSDTDYDNPGNYSTGGTTAGKTGGEKTHTLTTAEMPSHSHPAFDPGHAHTYLKAGAGSIELGSGNDDNAGYVNTGLQFTGIIINSTGGGQPHENRPPFYTLAFIMKL